MVKLKISFRKQFFFIFRIVLIYILICFFLFVIKGEISWTAFIITSVIIFVFDSLPALLLHLQYFLYESNAKIELNETYKKIIYSRKGRIKSFDLTELIKFETCSSFGGGTGYYAWAEYNYYRIIFSNGEQLIVTNFRVPNFEKLIKNITGLSPDKKLKFFCFLPTLAWPWRASAAGR